MIKSLDDIIKTARKNGSKTIAVAVAQDLDVLKAVQNAAGLGIANFILVGNEVDIRQLAEKNNISIEQFSILDRPDNTEACRTAVQLVSSGKAQILMKGFVDTAVILKAVLDKEIGLRTDSVLSHVAVAEIDGYERLFYITDAAMNIEPDLKTKKHIIENSLQVANAMGNAMPKVACVCAVEKANEKMQATLDAVELVKMNQSGLLKGCIVAGPLALDNAVSLEAAKHKGITDPAAGMADILLMPFIEAGNMLYKAVVFFARGKVAGIVVGAKAPIVLTSRADSDTAKLHSMAIGALMASNYEETKYAK